MAQGSTWNTPNRSSGASSAADTCRWNKLVEHSTHGRFGAGRLPYLTRPEGIVHFIGGTKPWHADFPANSLRRLYERHAALARVLLAG